MKYNDQSVEILSKKTVFGKVVACVRVLSTGEVFDIPFDVLTSDQKPPSFYNLQYRAMAARIENEIEKSTILAPYESACLPLPHQILALEKIMSGAYCRFLIADEVGMGKTIEAGLALKELKLRGVVKRVLIIVPVTVMTQWQTELKKHFNESFKIYSSNFINDAQKAMNRLGVSEGLNIWWQSDSIITSLDALRPLDKRQGWDKEKLDAYNNYRVGSVVKADFDLLIIDECHKVGGADKNMSRFKMAEVLCAAIPNVLLLSATPHRGKTDHFCRILKLLDNDVFCPFCIPKTPKAPPLETLEPYIIRTQKRQAIDYNGVPLFKKRRTECFLIKLDREKNAKQIALYKVVTDFIKTGLAFASRTNNSSYGLVMVLFQKVMSSSTQAIYDSIKRRLTKLELELKNKIYQARKDKKMGKAAEAGKVKSTDEGLLVTGESEGSVEGIGKYLVENESEGEGLGKSMGEGIKDINEDVNKSKIEAGKRIGESTGGVINKSISESISESINESINEWVSEGVAQGEDEDEAGEGDVGFVYEGEISRLKSLLQMAQETLSSEVDVKLEYLLKKLDELKRAENNFDTKFIIFTEFKSTQRMLCKELFERGGYKSVAINGSMSMDERLTALKAFKSSAQILISTDAAGESLNMQFAHIVINYDLPWNPMVIEQRIGRVDRIGQDGEVLAINMLINNSIDERVYDVIETKLSKILNDMGIDKTGDVLDSALEEGEVCNLYKTSILEGLEGSKGKRFEKASEEWLLAVKEKLSNYKATQNLLPTTKDADINLSKMQKIKHSSLGAWLAKMTEAYFLDKGIKVERTLDGLIVKSKGEGEIKSEGENENKSEGEKEGKGKAESKSKGKIKSEGEVYYTFDAKVSLENPNAKMLTLQSDLTQKIISQAVLVTIEDNIPIIKTLGEEGANGVFMIMKVAVRNTYGKYSKIVPLFICDNNQYFASYAQKLWADISGGSESLKVCGTIKGATAKELFSLKFSMAEKYLEVPYQELVSKLDEQGATMKKNKAASYNFQMQQVTRIGIEQIKNYRLKKYKTEYEEWLKVYERAKQITPSLSCLLIARVEKGGEG